MTRPNLLRLVCFLTFFLVWVVLLIVPLAVQANGPKLPSDVQNFSIGPGDSGSEVVTLVVGKSTYSCTFDYNSKSAAKAAPVVTVQVTFADLAKELNNAPCIRLKQGPFQYEVCLGNTAKQTYSSAGGESWGLGHFTGYTDKHEQLFDGGDDCSATSKRRAKVSFLCDDNAMGNEDQGRIVSVKEPQMCAYEFVIAIPLLCRIEDWPKVTSFSEEGDADDWFLELAKVGDGSIGCSAYRTDILDARNVPFASFSLSFDQLSLGEHDARYGDRRPVSTNAIQTSENGIRGDFINAPLPLNYASVRSK